MWCSTFTTIPRDDKRNISGFENEWRSNNLLGRSQNGWSDSFSSFSYPLGQRLRNLRKSAAKSADLVIDFDSINIQTGRYVGRKKSHGSVIQSERGNVCCKPASGGTQIGIPECQHR